jgi:hypothetical protein
MEKTFGEELIEAMEEAVAIAQGKAKPARGHIIHVPDVRRGHSRVLGAFAGGLCQRLSECDCQNAG